LNRSLIRVIRKPTGTENIDIGFKARVKREDHE